MQSPIPPLESFPGLPEGSGTLLALTPGQINGQEKDFGIRGVTEAFSPSELPPGCPKRSLGRRVGIPTRIFWNCTLAPVAPLGPQEALESRSENQDFLPLPGYFCPYSLHPELGRGSAGTACPKIPFPVGSSVQHGGRAPENPWRCCVGPWSAGVAYPRHWKDWDKGIILVPSRGAAGGV